MTGAAYMGLMETGQIKRSFYSDNSVTTRYNLLRKAEDYILKNIRWRSGSISVNWVLPKQVQLELNERSAIGI